MYPGHRTSNAAQRSGGMNRRAFASFIGAVFLPLSGNAQSRVRALRLGILRPESTFPSEGLIMALQQLGYSEGQTLILNEQVAGRGPSPLPELAMDMAQVKPDVIVTVGAAAMYAMRKSTVTIPVVFVGDFDPVAAEYAESLERPGGNATGIVIPAEGAFTARKLELLKQAVPVAKRIAVLLPGEPNARRQAEEAQAAASQLGVELVMVEVRGGEYEEAFARIVAAQAEALLVGTDAGLARGRHPVIDLAARYRLPAIYACPGQVRDGGLMAYGTNCDKLYSRVAFYIDRIFKGAKPGDLPIEASAPPELSLNLATARTMGLAFPPALLSRAGQVVDR